MADLFVKRRNEKGELESKPTPAFDSGKDFEQRLKEKDKQIDTLNLQIIELWETLIDGGFF